MSYTPKWYLWEVMDVLATLIVIIIWPSVHIYLKSCPWIDTIFVRYPSVKLGKKKQTQRLRFLICGYSTKVSTGAASSYRQKLKLYKPDCCFHEALPVWTEHISVNSLFRYIWRFLTFRRCNLSTFYWNPSNMRSDWRVLNVSDI
jgi:hypothetical protein